MAGGPMNGEMKNVSLSLRFTLFFVIFVFAVIAVIITTSIQQFNDAARITSVRLGLPIAKRAAAVIDGDAFEKLSGALDPLDPFYEEARLKLLAIKEETQCLYLYTMAPGEGDMYRFIIDGGNPGEKGFSPLGAEEDTSDYDKVFRLTWETKTSHAGVLDLQRSWGFLITTYVPILNSSGDMVGISRCPEWDRPYLKDFVMKYGGKVLEKIHLLFHNSIILVSILFLTSTAMVLLISVNSNIVMNQTVNTLEEATQYRLLNAARAASAYVSAEELDRYHTPEDTLSPEYEELRARLIDFAEKFNVLYVYYWRDYGDGNIQLHGTV
jgi:hypothetical protein